MEPQPESLSSGAQGPLTLAIDIGGSSVKSLVLDPAGTPLCERESIATPRPATPGAVLDVIAELATRQPMSDRVAVGFPGVVSLGITRTAPNLDTSWAGFPLAAALQQRLGLPVQVANDADVQGFGAIRGHGVELVLTLGTGLGSALFVDGILVPNLELAHHPFVDGRTYEQWLGQKALDELGPERWHTWLLQAIQMLRQTFNFDVLYIGGGNSRRLDPASLPADVRLVPNILGLLGGIALWTGMQGTSLIRAPQAEGASCAIETLGTKVQRENEEPDQHRNHVTHGP